MCCPSSYRRVSNGFIRGAVRTGTEIAGLVPHPASPEQTAAKATKTEIRVGYFC